MEIENEYIPQWEPLVEALRKELEEYGGLHILMNEQQSCILGRDTDGLLEKNDAVQAQAVVCNQLRFQREKLTNGILEEWGIDKEFTSLSQIIPHFPEKSQGLLQALVEQINHMIARTRQKARQNQLLLSRASDVIEQVVMTLRPQTVKTYNRRGSVLLKASAPSQGSRIQTTV